MSRRADAPADADAAVRLLRLGTFTSAFDRFSTPPLLVAIATAFDVPLGRATTVAVVYYLSYGLCQPVWGLVSDRLGRVRTMRLTLAGAGVLGLLAAAAPSLGALVALRAVQGGLFAAVIPAALVYVGDAYPLTQRQRPLAALVGAFAVAQALSTLVAGVLAGFASWRLAFALPATFAFVLVAVLRRVPEPRRAAPPPVLERFRRIAARPWARAVLALALVEGAVVLGTLTFLAPALESGGVPTALAGAVVAGQGVGVAAGSRFVGRAAGRLSAPRLLGAGGAIVASGITVAAMSVTVGGVLVAAVTVGFGFPLLHTTLQAWATDVAPDARATAISLFAASLFVGSSVGTAVFTPLADAARFSALFGLAAVAVVPLVVAAVALRARYRPA